MSNKQQTAVEWLIGQLQRSKDFHRVINEVSQMSSVKIDLIQQAKEMEKKQIADAYYTGDKNGCGCYDFCTQEDAINYYKETYEND